MKITNLLFTKKRAEDVMKRNISQLTLSTLDSDENNNNEIQNLKERMDDLGSIIITMKKEAQAREEILQNLIIVGDTNCKKLQAELESSKRAQLAAERGLMHAQLDQRLDQMNAKNSTQRVQDSAHTLCKVVSADRLWLEAKMEKRAATANARKQKNNRELARIKQKLSGKH